MAPSTRSNSKARTAAPSDTTTVKKPPSRTTRTKSLLNKTTISTESSTIASNAESSDASNKKNKRQNHKTQEPARRSQTNAPVSTLRSSTRNGRQENQRRLNQSQGNGGGNQYGENLSTERQSTQPEKSSSSRNRGNQRAHEPALAPRTASPDYHYNPDDFLDYNDAEPGPFTRLGKNSTSNQGQEISDSWSNPEAAAIAGNTQAQDFNGSQSPPEYSLVAANISPIDPPLPPPGDPPHNPPQNNQNTRNDRNPRRIIYSGNGYTQKLQYFTGLFQDPPDVDLIENGNFGKHQETLSTELQAAQRIASCRKLQYHGNQHNQTTRFIAALFLRDHLFAKAQSTRGIITLSRDGKFFKELAEELRASEPLLDDCQGAALWSFYDQLVKDKQKFDEFLANITGYPIPPTRFSDIAAEILDFDVEIKYNKEKEQADKEGRKLQADITENNMLIRATSGLKRRTRDIEDNKENVVEVADNLYSSASSYIRDSTSRDATSPLTFQRSFNPLNTTFQRGNSNFLVPISPVQQFSRPSTNSPLQARRSYSLSSPEPSTSSFISNRSSRNKKQRTDNDRKIETLARQDKIMTHLESLTESQKSLIESQKSLTESQRKTEQNVHDLVRELTFIKELLYVQLKNISPESHRPSHQFQPQYIAPQPQQYEPITLQLQNQPTPVPQQQQYLPQSQFQQQLQPQQQQYLPQPQQQPLYQQSPLHQPQQPQYQQPLLQQQQQPQYQQLQQPQSQSQPLQQPQQYPQQVYSAST
ncbi:hypothetical protein BGZ76_010332 [Entomortierella beljakovae]|nr:hypothetical protein BGZ76_010332 [Entomortierella beljakovae]